MTAVPLTDGGWKAAISPETLRPRLAAGLPLHLLTAPIFHSALFGATVLMNGKDMFAIGVAATRQSNITLAMMMVNRASFEGAMAWRSWPALCAVHRKSMPKLFVALAQRLVSNQCA